jgi:hypothetical protein
LALFVAAFGVVPTRQVATNASETMDGVFDASALGAEGWVVDLLQL